MTLTLKIESHFLHDIPAHGGAPQYQIWLQKIANKHSAEWEQICVTSVTSLTPEDTTVFPFSSKIIHHTQPKKRSNVAAASQLMWTGTLG